MTKLWQSIKKGTNTPSLPQTPQSPMDTTSYSLYHRITELPLSRWVDLVADGNKLAIVKEGQPPIHVLLDTEKDLRVQYADAIGDNEYKLYCGRLNEITRLEITLAQIQSLVAALREAYVPAFEKALNKLLLTSFVFDVAKPEQYDNNLQRALNRSREIKLRITLKKGALAKLEEKYSSGDGGQKATREYFMGILIELSDSAGYPLSDNITVWEFCERIKKHNKKNDLLTAKAKNRG